MTPQEKLYQFFKISEVEKKFLFVLSSFLDKKFPDKTKRLSIIKWLGIQKILIKGKKIYICLVNPGLFIGHQGSDFLDFQNFIDDYDFKGYEINLVEVMETPDQLLDYHEGKFDTFLV